jgi:hypothetical protein
VAQAAREFKASRWTRGNLLFPTRISVSPERVLRTKPRLLGSTEESIAIAKIASVKLANGLFFSDICIESTGGADPITSHGHRKHDAQQIRALIEQLQEQRDRT